MSSIGCLYGTMAWLVSLRIRYKSICNDDNYKAQTIYFGVYSIIMSMACSGLLVPCIWGVTAVYAMLGASQLSVLLIWIFIAMLVLCIIVLSAELAMGGLLGIVYQLRCNRRLIGWMAIAVFIIAVAGFLTGTVFVLS